MGSPQKVHLHTQSNRLDIQWQDGRVAQLTGEQLRQYCACSSCRAKNQVGMALLTDNQQIQSIAPMGSTGIQVVFADGHDRGVFPWEYLQAIVQGNALEFLENQ